MAKYVMQEMADIRKEGEKTLYPRILINGCCETDELAEIMAKGSTLSRGEIKASLDLLAQGMASLMAKGCSVRLKGIGLFTPSLTLKKGKEREKDDGKSTRRNASSIEVGNINFRADKDLINETNAQCVLEKEKGIRRCNTSKYSPEERLSLAIKHLETNHIMTIGEYERLTGLSRTAAGKELKKWAGDPESGISYKGSGSHKVYVKR